MSDKPRDKLNELDLMLRRAYPVGMRDGKDITIEKRTGFELFNTRQYHNYETWSDGYYAYDDKYWVKAEDLDDCIRRICEIRTGEREPHLWEIKDEELREEILAQIKAGERKY